MTLCDRLNTLRYKYCKGCKNTTVQNIAVIKEAAAPARLGTPTYPKDEIENEKQIFHTFHPALHFTHGCAGIVAITADISYQDFCNFLSQLDINHTDTMEKRPQHPNIRTVPPLSRRAPFDTAHLRARASRWGTPPVRQDTTRDKLGWRSLQRRVILLSFIWNRESKTNNIEEFIPRIKPNFVVGTPDVKKCDSKFVGI